MVSPTIQNEKNEIRKKYKKNVGTKSSGTNTNVSNRILIMGDSIVKHIRGNYHAKGKIAKFMLRTFRVKK